MRRELLLAASTAIAAVTAVVTATATASAATFADVVVRGFLHGIPF